MESKALAEALREYVKAWSRQNSIPAQLNSDQAASVPLPGDETLFRVAQEALANVTRHSHAQNVTVEIASHDHETTLKVEDDGVGFDMGSIEKGIGLDSMRERLETIGGRLDVSSEPSHGTKVVAIIRRSQ